ncbi:MAG: hypothetical protein QNJ32_01510 [Xenococcaceae cyanobacterium MO_167.B27]|nr:hypothetical protein [Xenococcaceae cyanobacterium MO_167.B27]
MSTIKEQLLQEIQSSSDSLLEPTLDFLRFLKTKEKNNVKTDKEKLISSTGKNLVEHLKKIDAWSGDDLEECLRTVKETRFKAR